MVKVIFHTIRNCSQRKAFASRGSKFFPLGGVAILKRDALEESNYLVQKYPFDMRNFFSVLATPLSAQSDQSICSLHEEILGP